MPRLLPITKSWPDRNVSTSELNHGTALERVKEIQGGLGEQSQAPLAPLAAAAALHCAQYCAALEATGPADRQPVRAGSACPVKVVLFTGEVRHCGHMCAIIIRSMNRRNRREAAGCRTDTIRKKCRAAGTPEAGGTIHGRIGGDDNA